MNQELNIKVTGRVQGVNFRRRLHKFADQLGLTGYVENSAEGAVIVVAQGKQASLEELLLWCQKGSFLAKVHGMSYEWKPVTKEYKEFSVLKEKNFVKDQMHSFVNLGKEVLTEDSPDSSKLNQIPNHVVIIPDGNRRWARERGWLPWIGHKKAIQFSKVNRLLTECKKMGIDYLTLWAFSTENWKRDQKETGELFNYIRDGYKLWRNQLKKHGIRFRHMGRKDRLPGDIAKILKVLEKETKNLTELNFQLCLDYNGRDDIVRAINKVIEDGYDKVNEQDFLGILDSKEIPEPDLIIRTSGEKRTSGIMAYQAAYAELYFTNIYFPDFDVPDFQRAIIDYSTRKRNFGGTHTKDNLKYQDNSTLSDPGDELYEEDKISLNV